MSETMNDVYLRIDSEVNDYLTGLPEPRTVVIENVAFREIFRVYGILDKEKADIFLPGEIGYENVTVIYRPTPIFNFIIHSEPCINYRWKIKQNGEIKFSNN